MYGVTRTAGAWTDGGAELDVTSVPHNSKEALMVTGEANGRRLKFKLFRSRYPASGRLQRRGVVGATPTASGNSKP